MTSQRPVSMQVQIHEKEEIGVLADLTNVWHTPNTFIMDFLAVTSTPTPTLDEHGNRVENTPDRITARLASRVRIPPEQVFALIKALQAQSDLWLAEQNRSAPPPSWPSIIE